MRPPTYLRSEGAGEDSSLANSLKQSSEVFLTDLGDGRTELRMKLKIDVFGRLGGFGLNIIKTKADRMWEDFGRNLGNHITQGKVVT
jgi:carbon monoxide dehydrogenase subunit G